MALQELRENRRRGPLCPSLCPDCCEDTASSAMGYGSLQAQANGVSQPWTEASETMTPFLLYVVFLRYFNHSDEGNRNVANI